MKGWYRFRGLLILVVAEMERTDTHTHTHTHTRTKYRNNQTNAKSQGLVPAHFALIMIIVVHVVKHQSVINKYMQKAGKPENDAGFLKVKNNCCSACSQLKP